MIYSFSKKMGEFYFVSATEPMFYLQVSHFQACTTKQSTNPYFGGHVIDQIDTRSLSELKKLPSVSGLWVREGGAAPVNINPIHLFETRKEANEHLKNGQGVVIV